ncbi:hypothetical protein SAMN05421640_1066 [Ekhidna lutea]|uniref:SGNH/GDSL hydrolase family protein n=1 Tax=Ekhidna lutea TaxID=447679 RepID=A0A239GYH1_EKHLU|nr:hypothetical protein [Ekhidna lutea]SNS74177.1 hypothetical protein SAMN05421640_1066 [Ekhidna lutea]
MKYPHPRVWGVVIMVFSALFFSNLQFREVIREHIINGRIKYIFDSYAKSDAEVKVVFLCSSHGKDAISDGPVLNQKMKKLDSISYEFVKVPIPGAALEDFTTNQLLIDRLADYNPDYLLIQESYLFIDLIKNINSFSLRKTISFQNIKEILDGSGSIMEQGIQNKNTRSIHPDSLMRTSNFLVKRSNIRSSSSLKPFRTAFDAKLIVFEIPLPAYFETLKDSIRQTNQYKEIFTRVKRQTDFTYVAYPNSHPFSHYFDVSHMNDIGEQVYTDWLLKRISGIHNE